MWIEQKKIIEIARKRKEDYSKEQKEEKNLSDWQLKYVNAENDEDLYKAEIDENEQYDKERK